MSRVRPHFKVHVSIDAHPKTARIWLFEPLRSAYCGFGRLAISRYAGKTDDSFIVSMPDLLFIFNCRQERVALRKLRWLCQVAAEDASKSFADGLSVNDVPAVSFEVVREKLSESSREVPRTSRKVSEELYRITIANLAKKNGLAPENVVLRHTKDDVRETSNTKDLLADRASRSTGRGRSPPKVEIGEGCFWLAAHLRRSILAAFPDRPKVPAETEAKLRPWAGEIERMIRIDGREPEKLKAAIDWALGPNLKREASFVVLSAKALRSKYDSMSIAAQRELEEQNGKRGKPGSAKNQSVAEGVASVLRTMERYPAR